VVANQANNANNGNSAISGNLDVNAGLLVAEKITLVGPNAFTNAHGNLTLSGTGAIYLGTGGLVGNVGYSNTSFAINLNGGTLGAKDDFSITGNGTLNNTFTLKAADLGNNARNITNNSRWSGTGSLVKSGAGVLTMTSTNNYSGSTTINEGTLALVGSGAISNSGAITIATGASLDVSAASGFSRTSAQSLGGNGTVVGVVSAYNNSTISAGVSVGRLTFSGDLIQAGGVNNSFELTAATNDTINVTGTLNVSGGTNAISVVALGGPLPAGTYKLIEYGTLIGGVTNFTLSGAPGSLTNDTVNKTISLITPGIRGATNVVWVGGSGNNWDVINSVNWKKQSDGSPEFFVNGDHVRFDADGAANSSLTVVGSVQPGSVTVDAAANYTFGGNGSIGGIGTSLTKSNSGTLTLSTTNGYTGATTIAGGVVETTTLANGGTSSGIGASPNLAANLVLNGGTLRYLGTSVTTDRAATLGEGGGTLDVVASAAVLTLNGTLTGGSLTKSGAGQLTLNPANSYTNGTIINSGTLQLNAAGSAGTGGITNNGAVVRLNTAIVPNVPIDFTGTCRVELSGVGGGNAGFQNDWSGSGTVLVNFLTQNAAQTFSMGGSGNGGDMWDFSGTLDLGTNSGNFRFNNNESYNLGSSNATFNLGTGDARLWQRNGNTTTHLGALLGGPNTRLEGRRGDVSGQVTYSIGGNNTSTTFAGFITNGANATAITKVGSGTLRLTGSSPYTGATTVESGTLQVDGAITTSAISVIGGTLSGNGLIGGGLDVQFGGTLSPGASIGRLTISNSLSLASGSITVMELNKAAGTNDSIVGLSSISYGGTLTATNLGGPLAVNDTFVLFGSAPGSYFGAFETFDLPTLPTGLVWDTSGLLVDGSIKVVAPTLNVMNNGTSLDFSWAGNFKLQAQTNSLSIGISNNWFDYPGGGSSPVNVPIDAANGSVFFRLSSP
jgi:autotransporter-associated beta strand protein